MKDLYIQVKKTMSRIKTVIKSSFTNAEGLFFYKWYKGSNNPIRLDTVTVADPNDSGVTTLLTFGATIIRTMFW